MSSRCNYLLKYFDDRSILLKEDWLDAVIEFLHTRIPAANNYNDEKFANLVFEQWKCSDLESSTFPVFANHGLEPSTSKKLVETPIICQINSIIDVGTPFYAQYCNLSDKSKEDNTGFDKVFHEKEEDNDKKVSRLLKLVLSDGEIGLKAIEVTKIPQLSLYIKPGCKIMIAPPFMCRKGILFLKPINCKILGGECLPQLEAERPLNKYRKLLKIPENPKERKTSTANSTTSKRSSMSATNTQSTAVSRSVSTAPASPVRRPSTSSYQSTSYNNHSSPVLSTMNNEDDDEDLFSPVVRVSSFSSRLAAENTSFSPKRRNLDKTITKETPKVVQPKPSGMLTSTRNSRSNDQLKNMIEEDEEPINYSAPKRFTAPPPVIVTKLKSVKIEQDDDDEIEIIDFVVPSKISKTEEKADENPEQQMTNEEQEALDAFSILLLSRIADCLKRMKYCIGSRKFTVLAVVVDVVEALRVVDGLWTQKVKLKDELQSIDCLIDNGTLESLIGLSCQEAIDIRKSSDMEKRQDGKRRLDALGVQLQRLDLIFEIEFFNGSVSIPIIRSIKTMAERLDAY